MRRRDLIALLGGAAVAWPRIAGAQQGAMPVIGFLTDFAPETVKVLDAIRQGLAETGYIEGRNVAIEYRYGREQYDRMPALAADLVSRNVAVIVTTGSEVSWESAKAATSTIPIVATFGGDPVKDGVVASINRPGGNLTGAALFTGSTNVLDTKRIELLHELVPKASVIGILVGPHGPLSDVELHDEQAAAETLGLSVKLAEATGGGDLDAAFASLSRQGARALLQSPNALFNHHRAKLIALAARYGLPTIYEWPEYVRDGGLTSYGTSIMDVEHQVGVYAGRILKGEKPGDLPIVLPERFRLAVNAGTAKALGIAIPPTLLVRADEVVE